MNLKKAVALSLSCCLLGQSALVAAPKGPSSLKEYQARARANIKTAPWIKEESKWVMMAGGLPIVTVLSDQITELRRVNAEQEAVIKQLRGELAAQKVTNTELEKRLAELGGDSSGRYLDELFASYVERDLYREWEAAAIAAGEKEIGSKAAYIKEHAGTLPDFDLSIKWDHEVVEAGRRKIGSFDAYLAKNKGRYSMEVLEKQMVPVLSYLKQYKVDADLNVFQKNLLANLSENNAWFRRMTAEEQREFVDLLIEYICAGHGYEKLKNLGFELVKYDIFGNSRTYSSSMFKRVLALFRVAAKNPATYVIGGVLFMSLFSQTVQEAAQKTGDRIRQNPELFLNATPEDLARLEKDKETREACIEVSNSLYLLSAMTKSEMAPYEEVFHRSQQAQKLQQNRSRGRAR